VNGMPLSSGSGVIFERAAILAVGSELLGTSRVDTNSLFMTEQLNMLGIEVAYKSVVGDDRAQLGTAVRFALDQVGFVVCCGGLGPTDDDVTREVVAAILGRSLTEDEAIATKIRDLFASRGMNMPEINRRQAMVPVGARVLNNSIGTAPGLWIEDGDRAVLLLPGPPRELKPMLASAVDGILSSRSPRRSLITRVVRITGRTESHAEEAVRPLYTEWARAAVPVSATILASLGQIELHLSARAESPDRAAAAAKAASLQVSEALGLDAYSLDGHPLEQVVGDLLVKHQFRIALDHFIGRSLKWQTNTESKDRLAARPFMAGLHDAIASTSNGHPIMVRHQGAEFLRSDVVGMLFGRPRRSVDRHLSRATVLVEEHPRVPHLANGTTDHPKLTVVAAVVEQAYAGTNQVFDMTTTIFWNLRGDFKQKGLDLSSNSFTCCIWPRRYVVHEAADGTVPSGVTTTGQTFDLTKGPATQPRLPRGPRWGLPLKPHRVGPAPHQ